MNGEETFPPTIEAVAVAVVPIPAPTDNGGAIFMETVAPSYPLPCSFNVNPLIVPAAETIALTPAATTSVPCIRRASKSGIVTPKADSSYSKNLASSTKISGSPVLTVLITLAVG